MQQPGDDTPTKSARTRALILEHALRLFQEQGFEKTTMRGIAEACDLSLGAAYYHFPSKEALVLAFYQQGAVEARRHALGVLGESKDFITRLDAILRFRLEQLSPYRNLVGVLARQAADMASPLSPFSPATKAMRDDAIALFAEAMDGSNLKVAKALAPHLPKLLWMMQLGIVLYWSNDRSAAQQRTNELLDQSLKMLRSLLRVTTLPLMGPVVQAATRLIRVAEACLLPGEAAMQTDTVTNNTSQEGRAL
jgi:AcrR family transcriptional regulator